MREDRTPTMVYDETRLNAEATGSPAASRPWSFVVDAALGPLSVTAHLGFRRNKRNLTVA
jgi:hypothetical protein